MRHVVKAATLSATALALASCVPPPQFRVINNTGAPIVVDNGRRERTLDPGEVSGSMRFVTTAWEIRGGGCTHTYPGLTFRPNIPREIYEQMGKSILTLAVVVEPDFTLHAYAYDYRVRGPAGAEFSAAGLPMTPERACAPPGENR